MTRQELLSAPYDEVWEREEHVEKPESMEEIDGEVLSGWIDFTSDVPLADFYFKVELTFFLKKVSIESEEDSAVAHVAMNVSLLYDADGSWVVYVLATTEQVETTLDFALDFIKRPIPQEYTLKKKTTATWELEEIDA